MYAKQFRSTDNQIMQFISTNEYKYDRIIIDPESDLIYTSYLFYASYPPQDFQNTSIRAIDDSEGFSKVLGFGKVEYRPINWSEDLSVKNLIVTTKDNKPNNIPILKEFSYPLRPAVISANGQILIFPVTDGSYVIVEGNEN